MNLTRIMKTLRRFSFPVNILSASTINQLKLARNLPNLLFRIKPRVSSIILLKSFLLTSGEIKRKLQKNGEVCVGKLVELEKALIFYSVSRGKRF